MARSRRSGFTMTEVVIVIAIMSLLVAIFVPASMSVIGTSREAATRAVLKAADKILTNRTASLDMWLSQSFNSELSSFQAWLDQNANQLPEPFKSRAINYKQDVLARVTAVTDPRGRQCLIRKEYRRILFPQIWSEAAFQLAMKQQNPPTTINPETESGEVLYWIIVNGMVNGQATIDQESIPAGYAKDTDGNGFAEIIDGWGKAVRYYRWPARLIRPNGLPANYAPRATASTPRNVPAASTNDMQLARTAFLIGDDGSRDPYDPTDAAINNVIPDSDIDSGNTSSRTNQFEQDYFLPSTSVSPFVVSSGPDGDFGIGLPNDKASGGYWAKPLNPTAIYDNLTSRQN